jgi:hypothetical protein
MANVFKNYTSASVGTSATTTYTVGSAKTAVLIGCNLANRHSAQIKVDVQCAGVFLVKGVPIPASSSLGVLDGKVILETTDTLIVTSDTASSVDVIASVLEQDV